MQRRPWRAAAYMPNPAGRPVSGGRTAAATLAGLARFIQDKQAAGWTVKVWKVLPLQEEPRVVERGGGVMIAGWLGDDYDPDLDD